MKNVSGNFLDDDELDEVVGGYDSVVGIVPDSSGQSMQSLHLSSRDNTAYAVDQTSSSVDTLRVQKNFAGQPH